MLPLERSHMGQSKCISSRVVTVGMYAAYQLQLLPLKSIMYLVFIIQRWIATHVAMLLQLLSAAINVYHVDQYKYQRRKAIQAASLMQILNINVRLYNFPEALFCAFEIQRVRSLRQRSLLESMFALKSIHEIFPCSLRVS